MIDQNLVKTLETELAETLVPLRTSLDTAREKADAPPRRRAAAAAEAARKDDELRLLRSRGAFGGDDATAPAKRANDVLKKRTGGVGFSETLIEQCCALTDACVEDLRAYEAELKAFNENPPAPPEPPKPGTTRGIPPPPQPPGGPRMRGPSRGARSRPCSCPRTSRNSNAVPLRRTTPRGTRPRP